MRHSKVYNPLVIITLSIMFSLLILNYFGVFRKLEMYRGRKPPDANTPAGKIPDATSCHGFDCEIEGQFCPQGVPGASKHSYTCSNKKWVKGKVSSAATKVLTPAANTPAGKIPDATSCHGFDCEIEGQLCPQGVPGASKDNYTCSNKKWVKGKVFAVISNDVEGEYC